MLERFEIYGLYGLYNYLFDFTQTEDKRMAIITGPNGYGKTTVLQLVYALFDKSLEAFFKIPFSRAIFHLGDEIIQVRQDRNVLSVDEESDLPGEVTIHIAFEQIDNMTGDVKMLQEFTEGDERNTITGQLLLLLNSMKCFFLTDERILHRNMETEKRVENADSSSSMIEIANKMAEIISKRNNERGIALFRDLVTFFKFADKEMILDGTFGIRFRINNASKTLIPVTALSSGEKHVLLQLFELIFESKSGDLVMIDEPELSFHPAWLNVYISVLKKIQDFKLEEGREMQIIMATHSPLLIGGRWNDTLDLYSLRRND